LWVSRELNEPKLEWLNLFIWNKYRAIGSFGIRLTYLICSTGDLYRIPSFINNFRLAFVMTIIWPSSNNRWRYCFFTFSTKCPSLLGETSWTTVESFESSR